MNQRIINCQSGTMSFKLETVKLIYPVAEGSSSIKFYVQREDIFHVMHDTHLAIGHGERNRMIKETQTKYKNITAGSIMLYLSLCVPSLKNSKVPKKRFGDQTNDI